eukprot:352413-Chlamydomonas_euryale.AAC.2
MATAATTRQSIVPHPPCPPFSPPVPSPNRWRWPPTNGCKDRPGGCPWDKRAAPAAAPAHASPSLRPSRGRPPARPSPARAWREFGVGVLARLDSIVHRA